MQTLHQLFFKVLLSEEVKEENQVGTANPSLVGQSH